MQRALTHQRVGLRAIVAVGGGDAHDSRSIPFAVAYIGAMTALTFVLAFASYHLLEKHFLALKRRFEANVLR